MNQSNNQLINQAISPWQNQYKCSGTMPSQEENEQKKTRGMKMGKMNGREEAKCQFLPFS